MNNPEITAIVLCFDNDNQKRTLELADEIDAKKMVLRVVFPIDDFNLSEEEMDKAMSDMELRFYQLYHDIDDDLQKLVDRTMVDKWLSTTYAQLCKHKEKINSRQTPLNQVIYVVQEGQADRLVVTYEEETDGAELFKALPYPRAIFSHI